jgi:hypothetical protein
VKQAVLSWLTGTPNLGLLVSATTIFGDKVTVNFSLRDDMPREKQPILVLFNDDGTQEHPMQINEENEEDQEEMDENELEETTELEDEEMVLMNAMVGHDRRRKKRYTKGQPEEPLEFIPGNRPEKFHREKKSRVQAGVNRSQKIHG